MVNNDYLTAAQPFIDGLREILAELTDEQRLEVFAAVKAGYCRYCGCYDGDCYQSCQCWNDE